MGISAREADKTIYITCLRVILVVFAMAIKDIIKPVGKFKISRIFLNKANGQLTVILPKRKMKKYPTKLEVSYW